MLKDTSNIDNIESKELVHKLFLKIERADMVKLKKLMCKSQDLYIADCINAKLEEKLRVESIFGGSADPKNMMDEKCAKLVNKFFLKMEISDMVKLRDLLYNVKVVSIVDSIFDILHE